MLGGGVGFSVRREDVYQLPKVKKGVMIKHLCTKDADFIVPDSRQGWTELLRRVLEALFITGKSFTYSTILVRGAGEPIKGFGGVASGPVILTEGIEKIIKIIAAREGKKIRSIDALDVCNIIANIVIAGNLRRSATISLGDPDDILFLRAKRWDLGNIPNWRSMSNNTIYADEFDHIMDEIWEGYNGNGEPYGFFNLRLSQQYGRIKDGKLKKEDAVSGVNPCLAGETEVLTSKGYQKIVDIADKEVLIYNGEGYSPVVFSKTGTQSKLLRVNIEGSIFGASYDLSIYATPEHSWYTEDGTKIKTADLMRGMLLESWINDDDVLHTGWVTSVVDDGRKGDVYCCTEPFRGRFVANGVITGNCGEIPLMDKEICNLSELYLNNIPSLDILIDCSKLLYKTQKAICSLSFIHDDTTKIVHKNMRLGQGVTGICQSLGKLDWLDKCYTELREFDKQWSKIRGWPESIKISTVKPSGSLSLLAGSTPGAHPAFSQYYIRRVRMASTDKLVKQCKDAGYKAEYVKGFDGSEDHSTVVVEFPCQSGEGAILAKDMSAIKQLELVKTLQSIWSDNAVSVTVYYSKDELPGIKEWLKEHYKGSIKSVSFLLRSEHGFCQPPYEEITKEQYEALMKHVKPLVAIQGASDSMIDGLGECSSGSCPIR